MLVTAVPSNTELTAAAVRPGMLPEAVFLRDGGDCFLAAALPVELQLRPAVFLRTLGRVRVHRRRSVESMRAREPVSAVPIEAMTLPTVLTGETVIRNTLIAGGMNVKARLATGVLDTLVPADPVLLDTVPTKALFHNAVLAHPMLPDPVAVDAMPAGTMALGARRVPTLLPNPVLPDAMDLGARRIPTVLLQEVSVGAVPDGPMRVGAVAV